MISDTPAEDIRTASDSIIPIFDEVAHEKRPDSLLLMMKRHGMI